MLEIRTLNTESLEWKPWSVSRGREVSKYGKTTPMSRHTSCSREDEGRRSVEAEKALYESPLVPNGRDARSKSWLVALRVPCRPAPSISLTSFIRGVPYGQVGDGTTSVVIIAAELLKRANELIKNNIHPTTVMAGYRLALKEAVKYIKANLCVPVDKLGRWASLATPREGRGSG